MFLLQKATEVTDDGVLEVFAYPDSDAPTVRATMVASIDGAATIDGRSGMLGGDGDHLVFHAMRTLSDAVVVGARTALNEDYGAVDDDKILLLASRTLEIPTDYAAAVAPNTLIATCANAPADARDRLTAAGATVIDCGEDAVEPDLVVDALVQRGARRIDLEGGPRLLGSFAAAGRLDQLIYTISPTLVADSAPRIAHDATIALRDQDLPMPDRLPYPMAPTRILGDDEGFVFMLWEARR